MPSLRSGIIVRGPLTPRVLLRYIRYTALIYLSAFFVVCLCVARTLSLLRPFQKQKIRYLVIAVTLFIALVLALIIAIPNALGVTREAKFNIWFSSCVVQVDETWENTAALYQITVSCKVLLILAQAVTVIVSCIISVVVLTRKNKNVQQRELQQSRNRATVTILLFALLYGVYNIPYVVYVTMWRLHVVTGKAGFIVPYLFDTKAYYYNAVSTLLPVTNSALNPVLYYWRMKPLREYTVTSVKKILRLNKVQVRRPPAVPANNKQ